MRAVSHAARGKLQHRRGLHDAIGARMVVHGRGCVVAEPVSDQANVGPALQQVYRRAVPDATR